MSTLLTHEEYCPIAENITYPDNPSVNGEYGPPYDPGCGLWPRRC